MECPECKSREIVWDYKCGNLVCSNCGLVLDKIYDDHNYIDNEIMIKIQSTFTNVTILTYKDKIEKIDKIIKFNSKLSKKQLPKSRKLLNYNNAIIRSSSATIIKYLDFNEKLLLVYDIIDTIPILNNISIKYKVALAMYFYDKKTFNKIMNNLEISNKYFNKILRRLNSKEKMIIMEKVINLLEQRVPSQTLKTM
ncbi:TFIIB-type zinc ribbon-containing protein [Sulfolobus acidocaldarius]|uniref:Conserved protein n=4 Tax=Sulfolobus acidocaldarius TaxID=2285 RepID=Q4JAY0_SULAC|nr:TFIIB-type zinc ribbon-containing protein [Sulfolobus acidocaldarius]AAY80049.1 conserved protein [Sulfolobus acidocaldarius DSM 639]AGE70620.1 hypothetical protein SacN8_03215 [Sulfolobus acidocaldarius N8]AGE72893.1 hypothetical protein SacRon12I_03205 [Sulfolobus acidocaldarius Ron12/I]ALU29028.1 hypothetical protein ATY89_03075 [Sulfolobus acidocaldarius]ALU31754.1 hypothetical protein ATZ20_06100 [Sulfolobus acidocaldarius]